MKKQLLGTLVLAAIGGNASAQLPVSTSAQNRNVVLEEFTGIHCQWCPDGHKRANDLKAAKPAGDVILVNIHTGGFAQPSAGEPDFRTADGNAIAAISGMNITGYPTGSINRYLFSGQPGFAINRSYWAGFADSILAKPSYVNVALEGSLNVQTRQLTVNLQAYYTGASPAAQNRVTVMLLENNVKGPQIGGVNLYPAMIDAEANYTHNHMLRKTLTAATGDTIGNTTGTVYSKSYTYTVPAQYVNNPSYLGNLQLVAFISEGPSGIVTGAYGPITNNNFVGTVDGQIETGSVAVKNEICIGSVTPKFKLYNNGSTAITSATFNVNANGAGSTTASWTGNIPPLTTAYVTLPTYNFTANPTNTLNISIASINGAADPVAAGNTIAKSGIDVTTRIATDDTVTMVFVQDRFGSESSWQVVNQTTGAVVASGGPYADLAANGIQTHTVPFRVVANTCYKVTVNDSYGDGLNSGAGAGGYSIKSNGLTLYTSNGRFTNKDETFFKSAANLAVADITSVASSVTLAPNPATSEAVLTLDLVKSGKLSVNLVDVTGRIVNRVFNNATTAGQQRFVIATDNLPAGIYNVVITSEEGSFTQRLSVVK